MMKHLYFGAIFLYTFSGLFAQKIHWQKDLKSSTQDFLSGLAVTVDRQFLVSGSSIQPPKMTGVSTAGGMKQNNGYDFHLVKLDQEGEEVWEKYLGGNNHDFLNTTVSTQEGGFLLAGTSFSSKGTDKKQEGVGGSDIWLVKLSENGEEEWQQTFGTKGNEEARDVVQVSDLGYFIAGSIEDRRKGFGSKDVWIIRADQNGNPTQELVLGGNGMDQVEKMIPTLDGGVLIGVYSRSGIPNTSVQSKKTKEQGTSTHNASKQEEEEEAGSHFQNLEKNATNSNSSNRSHTSNQSKPSSPIVTQWIGKNSENEGEGDFWVIKLNAEGNVEWQYNFGGVEDDHLRTLTLTSTGYVVGGESRSKASGSKTTDVDNGTDIWLVALDLKGNKEWEKNYSFGNRDLMMSLSHVTGSKSTETRGFLLGGYTQAEGRMEKDDETFWMLYIDPNGEEIWRKHIEGESRQKQERLVTARFLTDGSYILAGTSAKEAGKENWKVVKLGDDQLDDLIVKHDIKIYPNPVDDYCYVEIGFAKDKDFKDAVIDLYDMSGRHVQSTATRTAVTKISTNNLIQGTYLVSVKTNHNKTANAKVIKK